MALGTYDRARRPRLSRAPSRSTRRRRAGARELPISLRSIGRAESSWDAGRTSLEHSTRPSASIPTRSTSANSAQPLLYLRRCPRGAPGRRSRPRARAREPRRGSSTRRMTYLGEGDLAGARAAGRGDVAAGVEPTELVAYFAVNDLGVGARRRAARCSCAPDAERRSTTTRRTGRLLAGLRGLARGDPPRARAYAEEAARPSRIRFGAAPEDASVHVVLGSSSRISGRKDEAIREGHARDRARSRREGRLSAGPTSSTSSRGSTSSSVSRRRRIDQLEPLLKIPVLPARPAGSRSTPTSTRCARTRGSRSSSRRRKDRSGRRSIPEASTVRSKPWAASHVPSRGEAWPTRRPTAAGRLRRSRSFPGRRPPCVPRSSCRAARR